jgi:hypothetical protein
MYHLLTVLLLLMVALPSYAQQLLTWETLGDVKFTPRYSEELGIEVLEAAFGTSVKALDNQQVLIKGFMIPLDPLGTKYVLSKNPMASCFFCGKAGPETVVELRLHPKSIRRYTMDEVHTFKGTLKLNAKDWNMLHYIIEEAERQ